MLKSATLDRYVQVPSIVSKTDNYGLEGGQLELTCSVSGHSEQKLEIKWELPKSNISIQVGNIKSKKILKIKQKNGNSMAL